MRRYQSRPSGRSEHLSLTLCRISGEFVEKFNWLQLGLLLFNLLFQCFLNDKPLKIV